MRFRPCLRAVDSMPCRVAKFPVHCSNRKPPKNLSCRSCSAKLFVKGTAGSCRKRSTSSRRFANRNARLRPVRQFLRPRRPDRGVQSGGFLVGQSFPQQLLIPSPDRSRFAPPNRPAVGDSDALRALVAIAATRQRIEVRHVSPAIAEELVIELVTLSSRLRIPYRRIAIP